MDIKNIAWGIAVNRILPPPKSGDAIVREIAIKKYADDLLLEQERIISNFNDVIDALDGFVLVSKEIPDSVVDRLRYSSYHWGDGTRDYFTPVYQMMIEAQEQK